MAKEEKKDEKGQGSKAAEKAAELSPEEAAAKAKKRKLLIFIAGGAVLTAAIGGGLAFFLAGGKRDMAAKTAEESPSDKKEDKKDEKKEDKKEDKKDEKKEDKKDDKKEAAKDGEKKDDKKEAGKDGEKKDDKKDDKVAKLEGVDFGCTVNLAPFHLNLGNPLENRYIRLELAVEYGCADDTKAEIDRRLPQLRDAVINVTTRKTREFLLGPDGKEQLRKEIFTRINQYMAKKIDDVFITDILIE